MCTLDCSVRVGWGGLLGIASEVIAVLAELCILDRLTVGPALTLALHWSAVVAQAGGPGPSVSTMFLRRTSGGGTLPQATIKRPERAHMYCKHQTSWTKMLYV